MLDKKKILCLHGNAANKEIMDFQLKQFTNEFKQFEFVTFNGPVEVSNNIIWNERLAKMVENQKVYAWGNVFKYHATDVYRGFQSGTDLLVRKLKEDGPFYGIMGFSQSSNIVSRLAVSLSKKEIDLGYELKCFIFFSGVPCTLPYGEVPVCRIPSAHFVGLNDFLVDRSMALTLQFLNPLVVYHNQGHRIPILNFEQVRQLKKFLLTLDNQLWATYGLIPKL